MLAEITAGKIVPSMKKVHITLATNRNATILGYTRDSIGCNKAIRGLFSDKEEMSNHWMNSGYVYFILTTPDKLLEIKGFPFQYDLLLYAGKPYFITPSIELGFPRNRLIMEIKINEFIASKNPNPEYFYITELCQFMTVNKPARRK